MKLKKINKLLRIILLLCLIVIGLCRCSKIPFKKNMKTISYEQNKTNTDFIMLYESPQITKKTPYQEEDKKLFQSNSDVKPEIEHEITFLFESDKVPSFQKSELIKIANNTKGRKFLIEGFTDSIGPFHVNKKLALNRAKSVKEIIKGNLKNGGEEAEITTIAKPMCCYKNLNKTKNERSKNRRVKITIL